MSRSARRCGRRERKRGARPGASARLDSGSGGHFSKARADRRERQSGRKSQCDQFDLPLARFKLASGAPLALLSVPRSPKPTPRGMRRHCHRHRTRAVDGVSSLNALTYQHFILTRFWFAKAPAARQHRHQICRCGSKIESSCSKLSLCHRSSRNRARTSRGSYFWTSKLRNNTSNEFVIF